MGGKIAGGFPSAATVRGPISSSVLTAADNLWIHCRSPSATSEGWHDLAYDSHLLYGSDGSSIVGIDTLGVEHTRIYTSLNLVRGLAYDPATDHFWIANETSRLLEIDRGGAILQQLTADPSDSLMTSGLAWFCRRARRFQIWLRWAIMRRPAAAR